MYEKKGAIKLSSNTTLRFTNPGGNSRNFINMKNRTGYRALCPTTLGNDAEWKAIAGPGSAKVRGP
jgi:hypothetical protein